MKKALILLMVFSGGILCWAQIPDPAGLWQFNLPQAGEDPNVTLLKADIGNDLELVGSQAITDGITEGDGAVKIGVGSHYICRHGIAPNGGGTMVNEWTLLVDFSYPQSSVGKFVDFFQTDPCNVGDSDWTIHRDDGAIGIGAVGYSRVTGFYASPDTWYRMVMVVDNGTLHDLYINGNKVLTGNQQGIDGRFALADILLLFAANDGDDNEIHVSTVAIWGEPLAPNQVLTLGGPGEDIQKENLAPEVEAGTNQIAELTAEGSVTIELDGTVNDDGSYTVEWTKISGPNDIVFDAANLEDTSAVISAPGTYILQLTADDGEFTTSDTVSIAVRGHNYGGLLVEWLFDEPWSGTQVLDTSVNGNNGIIVDGPDGNAKYVAEGKVGQGLDLGDGNFATNGDYVEVPLVMPDSGTIAMWYKVNNLYNYVSLFDNSVQRDDWEMWIYGDSRLRFRIQSDNPVTANLNSLAEDGDATGDWFHITVTWQRTDATHADTALYVNGTLMDQNSGSWVEPGEYFYLGGGNNGNDYGDGIWDEVRIYDKVLTVEEIRDLIWSGNKPPIVDAGSNRTLWLGESGTVSVDLAGSVEDADGSPVGEVINTWNKISGPNDLVIDDISLPTSQVTFSAAGTYVLRLTADDGQFAVSDDVSYTIYPFGYEGLKVHWTFDQGDPNDSSGNGNDGIVVNGPNGDIAYVAGKLGKGLNLLDGDFPTDGDYIAANYVMTDSGTVAMWYKVNNLYNYVSLFDNSVQRDDWEMWIYGDSRLRFRIQSDNPVTANLNNLAPDGDARGDWFHIVVMWQRTDETHANTFMYVNGVLMDQNSGSWVEPGSQFFLGGGNDGNDYGDGIWDDVRVYDRMLTPQEIKILATASDFNNDKSVDLQDLDIFAGNWLVNTPECDSTPFGDLNMDCKVDLTDFTQFAQNWLEGLN